MKYKHKVLTAVHIFEPTKFTFLTIYVISLFWLLLILRNQYYIDYFRITFIFVSIIGIILNYFYGNKWENKYKISNKTRYIFNIIYHILPLVYLIYTKPIYEINYYSQILRTIVIMVIYCMFINPFQQYLL